MAEPIAAGPASRFESIPFPEDTLFRGLRIAGWNRPGSLAAALMAGLFHAIAPPARSTSARNGSRRMRHEDGATFNPFDSMPAVRETPMGAGDDSPAHHRRRVEPGMESGLNQRAQLLERILADVYGPQDLIHPPGHAARRAGLSPIPNFLRSLPRHRTGRQPSLSLIYAVDLYRGADGRLPGTFAIMLTPRPASATCWKTGSLISRAFSRSVPSKTRFAGWQPFFHTLHTEPD